MTTSGPAQNGHIKRVVTLTEVISVVKIDSGPKKGGHINRVVTVNSGHIKRGPLYTKFAVWGRVNPTYAHTWPYMTYVFSRVGHTWGRSYSLGGGV